MRTTSLEGVVHALELAGIKSLTISQINGIGEEVWLNTPYEKTDAVVNAILGNAREGG
jgi:nitrogen regulatory protein PII